MRMSVINVGYGDAILMEMTDGFTILLDGGSSLDEEFAGDPFRIRSIDYLKKQGISQIDLLLISHIHEDHVCGLEQVVKEIPVGRIGIPYPVEVFTDKTDYQADDAAPRNVHLYTKSLNVFQWILKYASENHIPVDTWKAGQELVRKEAGLRIYFLAPNEHVLISYTELLNQLHKNGEDIRKATEFLTILDAMSNATSFLLRIEVDGGVVLSAADNVPSGWKEVPSFMLENVNVLKLPHHGQKDAVDMELMKDMRLSYVITTSGSDRRYNSSNKEVYEKLSTIGRDGKPPVFLFSDERTYPPYFSHPEGFNATVLTIDSGEIKTEFSKIK